MIGMDRNALLTTAPSAGARASRPSSARPSSRTFRATAQELCRRRLGDVGHHGHHRRRPDPDRAGQAACRTSTKRPPHRALRQRGADPPLLLDPVGRLRVARANSDGRRARGLLSPRATTGTCPRCCKAMAVVARLFPQRTSGPISSITRGSSSSRATRSFAQAFAGTMPYSETIGFVADTDDPEEIDWTTYVIAHEIGPPILGPPGYRRGHAGRHGDQRDARPIFGADGDEAPLRARQDPPLPQVRARRLSARPPGRRGRGSCRSPGSRTRATSTTARARSPCICCRSGWAKTRSTARSSASSPSYRFKGAALPALGRPHRRAAQGSEDARAAAADHRSVRADHVYDLKVNDASTTQDGNEWVTPLTLDADKYYAGGKGEETKAALDEPIEVGLFTARPGLGDFSAQTSSRWAASRLRGGHTDHVAEQGQAGLRRGRPL